MIDPRMRLNIVAFLASLSASILAGCAGHMVRGIVVEGQTSGIVVVSQNDSRLKQGGLPGTRIELTIDPRSIEPKKLTPASTDENGRFEVAVKEPGAGLLEYELFVVARCAGYQAAVQQMPLPGGDKQLLIVLAPGRDTYRAEPNILEETMKTGSEMLKK